MFGILTNMARMPLRDGDIDIKMGLQFHQHDWYKVPFWPLISSLDIMTPQKLTQVSVGFHNPKAIQVARYQLVITFKGDNTMAEDMVWQAAGLFKQTLDEEWLMHISFSNDMCTCILLLAGPHGDLAEQCGPPPPAELGQSAVLLGHAGVQDGSP